MTGFSQLHDSGTGGVSLFNDVSQWITNSIPRRPFPSRTSSFFPLEIVRLSTSALLLSAAGNSYAISFLMVCLIVFGQDSRCRHSKTGSPDDSASPGYFSTNLVRAGIVDKSGLLSNLTKFYL